MGTSDCVLLHIKKMYTTESTFNKIKVVFYGTKALGKVKQSYYNQPRRQGRENDAEHTSVSLN